MKRTIFEVILALALVGAGAFGWTNWKQNQTASKQVTELKTASEEADKASKEKTDAIKAAEEEMSALRAEMAPLEKAARELTAVKGALANGATLADLETAYKSQKKLSAERHVGLGALRMLTKGAEDAGSVDAFRKALDLSELGDRKNIVCAAQLGLLAAGEQVTVLAECLPQSLKPEGATQGKSGKDAPTEKSSEKAGQAKDNGDDHSKPGDKTGEKKTAHWSYDGEMGPERWGKEFPTCAKGKSQAPLDIRGPFVKTRSVVTTDYKEGPLKMVNNGHTIQVNVPAGSKLRIDGVAYELLQFHFHRPSEEKLDGKPMAMVIHFVHKNAEGKLAVLGVLLKEGNENPGIKTLWANMPLEEGPEIAPDAVTFNPGNLLPREFDFFSYEGSLTTPPCTEGVRFFILKTTVNVAKEQVTAFPFKRNARPVQALNGREIFTN
ncbi:MAG: carbonic anhydrase family protein [Rhodoferax sp.]|nr:carbonic anhydrase family protein [Rhodoferax sp.]